MPSLALPLPDLVAVNARVRDRLEPVFKRRWVRRAAWALLVGYVLFVCLVAVLRQRPADLGEIDGVRAAAADQRARL